MIINLNYALWICFQSNESTLFGKNATLLAKHKDNATHVTSWRNMMTWFVREGIFFQFDASEVVSVVKENLGTLISVSGESDETFLSSFLCSSLFFLLLVHFTYSGTSRKRPPLVSGLSGRLWEVVAYRRWLLMGSFTK